LNRQLHVHLPEAQFSNITAGLPPPVVYLQQRHGRIELSFEAVRLELDETGDIASAKIVEPPE